LRDGLGITVVLVTHELESLYSIADRMIFLDGETHRPVAIGSPAELARSADSRKVRDFLARRGGVSTEHTEGRR
jgi:phospholipid/cholesterol/gamma-HCH transport system ATP-binding protein